MRMRYRVVVLWILFSLVSTITLPLYGQWKQTNGPFGGPVSSLAVSGNNLYAALFRSDVFMSSDDGRTWKVLHTGIESANIISLYATGTSLLAGTGSCGLLRSTDTGKSWTVIDSTIKVNSFLGNEGVLFAGTQGKGIFRSTDDGASWSAINSGLNFTFNEGISLAVMGSKLFAGTNQGVYLSTNEGTTWRIVPSQLYLYGLKIPVGVIGNTLLARTDYGVIRSSDYGRTWTDDSQLQDAIDVFGTIGTTVFAGGTAGFHRSTDLGESWIRADCDMQPCTTTGFIVNNQTIFVGTWNGVFRSTDNGVKWAAASDELVYSNAITITSYNGTLYAGTQSGTFRSIDNANTWTGSNAGLGASNIASFASLDSKLFGLGRNIYRSDNDGINWQATDYRGTAATCFITSNGGVFVGTMSSGIYRSTNYGDHWDLSNTGLPISDQSPNNPYPKIRTFGAIGNILFLGMDSGGVYRSTNDGLTWLLSNDAILAKSFAACAGDFFASAQDAGLYRSTDSGTSWNSVNQSFRGFYLTAGDSKLFAFQDGIGILMSTDTGVTWIPINQGLDRATESRFVSNLIVIDSDLYAATYAGVWRLPLSELIGQSAVHEPARSIASLHIYPNPTTSSTTITFTPEEAGHLDISLVNMLGVEVARVFSGEVDASEHTYTWGGPFPGPSRKRESSLNAGMYEVVVRMNGKVQAMPVIVQ
jgi:photosystem II stability/assembly factor-like uncharacterized protein